MAVSLLEGGCAILRQVEAKTSRELRKSFRKSGEFRMPGGRPRKPSALKALEGNRSRREIPPELPLNGTPIKPRKLTDEVAAEHFKFVAAEFGGVGVLKRADSPAVAKLADLWRLYWIASEANDIDAVCKLAAAWDRAASKLGIQVVDRAKLMAMVPQPEQADPTEERFFKVTG